MKMRIKSSMVSTALCLSPDRLTVQGGHSWGSNKSALNCGRPDQVIEWLLFYSASAQPFLLLLPWRAEPPQPGWILGLSTALKQD